MRSSDQGESIVMIKFIYYSRPEQPANASTVLSPTFDILWIWPHEISKWSFCGDLLLPIELFNLI